MAYKQIDRGMAKDVILLAVLIGILLFIKGMFSKIIPTDVDGSTEENQHNTVSAAQNQLSSSNQPKATLPAFMYSQIADNIFDIIDSRNFITGSYDNFALRKQIYLLQNSTDYLKTVVAFGVRPIKVGLHSESLTLPKILMLADDEDKKLLNKRSLEKKLGFYL